MTDLQAQMFLFLSSNMLIVASSSEIVRSPRFVLGGFRRKAELIGPLP